MTEVPSAPVRAGIYCRLSLARLGDTTKVEDQARICRELAESRGWEVAEIYTDNNESAWKKNRKRPEWNRMVADAEAGKISAIVVYHGDRMIRRPEDLFQLLKFARERGLKLASPVGERDLGNTDDEFILWIEAAMANKESGNISRRKTSEYARLRRAGRVRPGGRGGRAFGFATDGTVLGDDRCVIATRELTGEPRLIREIASRVLGGESIGSIARDVTARGWRSPAGRPMTGATLRKMLARPRYAGLMPDGEHKAAWDPVLDRGDWEMVRAILDAKAKGFGYATNARKWLLSGIAVCGECRNPLQIRQSRGRSGRPPQIGYGCVHEGCRKVHRSAALLDAYVRARTVGRLSREDNPEAEVQLHDGAAAELASLTTRRAETEAFIASLADAPAQRIEVLNRALDSFDAKISAIRERMAGDSAGRLRARYAGITVAEFDALPLDVRRALIRGCYRVIVKRASRRGPGFHEQDVTMVPV